MNTAIALYAIFIARWYQYAIKYEQDQILREIATIVRNTPNFEVSEFAKKVRADIENDCKQCALIEDKIKNYDKISSLRFSIRSNNMQEILDNANNILADAENIIRITQGNLPVGYNNEVKGLPTNTGEYYGRTTATIISTALWSVYFSLTDKSINDVNLENTATIYATECPQDLITPINYRFVCSHNTKRFFGFIHSGYAFGGNRFERGNICDRGTCMPPLDCSQYVSKVLFNSADALTTISFLVIYRLLTKHGLIPDESMYNLSSFANAFEVIKPKDARIGDIYLFRSFGNENPDVSFGKGGHVTIVIDNDTSNNNVLTIGDERDKPGTDGILVHAFPLNYPKSTGKEAYFLRMKSGHGIVLPLLPNGTSYESLSNQYKGYSNIDKILEYFDKIIVDQLRYKKKIF